MKNSTLPSLANLNKASTCRTQKIKNQREEWEEAIMVVFVDGKREEIGGKMQSKSMAKPGSGSDLDPH
jgi:hypothetical protein